jgi:hypothetical protein
MRWQVMLSALVSSAMAASTVQAAPDANSDFLAPLGSL